MSAAGQKKNCNKKLDENHILRLASSGIKVVDDLGNGAAVRQLVADFHGPRFPVDGAVGLVAQQWSAGLSAIRVASRAGPVVISHVLDYRNDGGEANWVRLRKMVGAGVREGGAGGGQDERQRHPAPLASSPGIIWKTYAWNRNMAI